MADRWASGTLAWHTRHVAAEMGNMNGQPECARPIWSGLAALIGGAVLLAACSASSGPAATPGTARATRNPASISTTKPSSSLPTLAAIEHTACSAIGAHESQGDRCAILSMHVSTVSPDWVLVEGLGFYSGTDQPPTVQEARSDLDELILNLRTGRMIGPTSIAFCQGTGSNDSEPDLSVVPPSVLAGWGLQSCTAGTSTTSTTSRRQCLLRLPRPPRLRPHPSRRQRPPSSRSGLEPGEPMNRNWKSALQARVT